MEGHVSTAEIPFEPPKEGELTKAAEDLLRVKPSSAATSKEPLFGTTAGSAKLALTVASKGTKAPLFGNRLRWAAKTVREAKQRRQK